MITEFWMLERFIRQNMWHIACNQKYVQIYFLMVEWQVGIKTLKMSHNQAHKIEIAWERGDLDKCMPLAVINFQDWGHVPTSIAIIRCTENGYYLLFLLHDPRKCTNCNLTQEHKVQKEKSLKRWKNYMTPVISFHD